MLVAWIAALLLTMTPAARALVRQLRTSVLSGPIVRAINDIAHVLDKRTIAEPTETEELVNVLRLPGVDFDPGLRSASA